MSNAMVTNLRGMEAGRKIRVNPGDRIHRVNEDGC
jgi:hypothetical protein